MRAFILLGPAALLLASSAQSQAIRFGATLAGSCYHAADARLVNASAMRACNMALSEEALLADDQAATYVNRGVLHLLSGRMREADRDFNEAIAINPRHPAAWLNKARVALDSGNSPAAAEMAGKALAFGTKMPALAHYLRAAAREDMGDLRGARADLVQARALAPDWALAAQELSRFQVRKR